MCITDVLDEFESWLWHHHPDALSSCDSGLTDKEIDSEFEKISLIPSIEIREMYKWFNGTKYLFDSPYYQFDFGINFFSIGGAIKQTVECNWIAEKINIKSFWSFPEFECGMHFLACDDDLISPVLATDEDFSPRIAWTSIASMVACHLEAYQQGILRLERYHSEDKTKLAVRRSNDFYPQFKAICDRHNPEPDYSNICKKYNLIRKDSGLR